MSVSVDVLDKVADIARNLLNERFGDDLVFDPRFSRSRSVDHYGDDYIQLYLVFDGDERKLDLDWTISMGRLMEPALLEMGLQRPSREVFHQESGMGRRTSRVAV